MNELNQQREDMRRLQTRQDALQAKNDEKFDRLSEQIHNNFVQTMLGMGAMMTALGGVLVAVLK